MDLYNLSMNLIIIVMYIIVMHILGRRSKRTLSHVCYSHAYYEEDPKELALCCSRSRDEPSTAQSQTEQLLTFGLVSCWAGK